MSMVQISFNFVAPFKVVVSRVDPTSKQESQVGAYGPGVITQQKPSFIDHRARAILGAVLMLWSTGPYPSYAQSAAPVVWGVNSGGDIFRWTSNTWQQIPGGLKDVSVGADGTVWGVNAVDDIFRWTGSAWQNVSGKLMQISVGNAQQVWGVNAANDIYRWTGTGWQQVPGKLQYVAVASDGTAWGVNAASQISRWDGSHWQQVPGGLTQLAVATSAPAPAPTASAGVTVTPIVTTPVTITGTPQNTSIADQLKSAPPTVDVSRLWVPSMVPPGGGSLMCSQAIGMGVAPCGTTKADYVGAYSLNMTCDSGFFDPIYGGTCWKCPEDTDQGGGWIRSATAIDHDDACWRVPNEKLHEATRLPDMNGKWAWDCPSGSFWDPYDGRGCWKCPDDYPRRTANPVYKDNACATPVNQTKPAILLKFNSCPKPDATTMGLKGKRLPGKPFLDIAGGWNQGVAAGGCYACPVTDEDGNIVIADRNANPIYGDNQGCTVNFKWKPNAFPEPGMSGLAGMRNFILESNLLDSTKLTNDLYFEAASRQAIGSLPKGDAAARDWVAQQWRDIAVAPYQNEALRAVVFTELTKAASLPSAQRTPAQTALINAFQSYIQARRVYLAQMGLAMYDAWKAYDDKAKQSVKRSQLVQMFDYGTVPLDFQSTLSATIALTGTGVGVASAVAAASLYGQQLVVSQTAGAITNTAKSGKEVVDPVVEAMQAMSKVSPDYDTTFLSLARGGANALMAGPQDMATVLQPLNLLKGTAVANSALAGVAVIEVAFAIIQSVAIDQFMAIVSARPKLEAALADAQQQPVDLSQMLSQPNGRDQVTYFWSKALEVPAELEDSQLVALAAAAQQQAQAKGYPLQLGGTK